MRRLLIMSSDSFFYEEAVDEGCYEPIKIRFEVLIMRNCEKPYDWYKNLGYDKGWASRVKRGLLIPKREDRIKIAQYFKTDSSTIWRNDDLPYIRQIIAKQKKEEVKNG